MVVGTVSSFIDIVSIIVWGAVVIKALHMADEGYGGKFTSVYPSLIGAFVIFLAMGILEWTHYEFFIAGRQAASDMFLFAIKTLQLIAGILLANALQNIYDINYATTGFFDGETSE